MTTTRPRADARPAARSGKRSGRLTRIAALSSAATVLVGLGITGAVLNDSSEEQSTPVSTNLQAATGPVDLERFVQNREPRVSRTAPRVALQPKATDQKFATAPLNIWTAPREQGKRLGLIKWGTKIAVTGQVVGQWAEVLLSEGERRVVRWVNADYLADEKPKREKQKPVQQQGHGTTSTRTSSSGSAPSLPSTSGACTNGTSVPSGVSPSIVAIHQAVCASWPEITTYGTFRAGDTGDHGSGRAVDIMVSGAAGWSVAEFVRANAAEFGVNYIIFSQKIWSIDRGGESWRSMEDRGSTTANHYDHVHVSVY